MDNTDLNFLHKIELACMRTLGALFRKIGFNATYKLARTIGLLVWSFNKKRRELATNNIQKHLKVDLDTARAIAKDSFAENICSFCEILFTQDFSVYDARLHIDNQENFQYLRNSGRPVVGVTGHFGSWELLAGILGDIVSRDLPRIVVTRRYPNPAVQQFITEQRQAQGATAIGHRTAATSVIRALRKKGLVAFLVDHRTRDSESVMLPFFEHNAPVNFGPALLGIRTEAVFIPIFLNREKDNTYTFYVYEALDTKKLEGSNEEKINQVALFYTKAVETHVRKYPAQWFWMHDRWVGRGQAKAGKESGTGKA